MISYDLNFVPPAPILRVGISAVDKPDQKATIPALLDTAADLSVLPDTLVDQLELAPVGETMVAGFEDHPIRALVYVVAVQVAGARLYPARVITHRLGHALLGRNVLNSLFVRLDGPDLQFEVKAMR